MNVLQGDPTSSRKDKTGQGVKLHPPSKLGFLVWKTGSKTPTGPFSQEYLLALEGFLFLLLGSLQTSATVC